MPSRPIIRSFLVLAALVGVGALSGAAQAGIIVTVGKPCPEVVLTPAAARPAAGQRPTYSNEQGDIRCVVMPDGQTKCGKSIRVDTFNMVPADWRCVPVTRTVLYCETPAFGGSPGAAGEGHFDPDAEYEELAFDDEEIQTLGCSSGGGVGALAGIGGVLVLLLARRRRA